MKLTARISILLSAVFAIACFVAAYKGFTSLGGMTDPIQIRDSKGFAGFWTFMGSLILGIAALSWWATEKEQG